MTKKTSKPSVVTVIAILAVIIGALIFFYAQANKQPAPSQQSGSANCKKFDNKEYCTDSYIGLKAEAAASKVESDGLTSHVVMIDGKRTIVDASLQERRINFTLVDGVVTKAEFTEFN